MAGHRHAIVLILRRARFDKPVRAWAAGVTAELRAPRLRRSLQLRLYTNHEAGGGAKYFYGLLLICERGTTGLGHINS